MGFSNDLSRVMTKFKNSPVGNNTALNLKIQFSQKFRKAVGVFLLMTG